MDAWRQEARGGQCSACHVDFTECHGVSCFPLLFITFPRFTRREVRLSAAAPTAVSLTCFSLPSYYTAFLQMKLFALLSLSSAGTVSGRLNSPPLERVISNRTVAQLGCNWPDECELLSPDVPCTSRPTHFSHRLLRFKRHIILPVQFDLLVLRCRFRPRQLHGYGSCTT